mmetsp:Transcript_27527/g.53094  ORF Transcript_27527/g.53094 Transcript_27527/m.53094 type:complete len:645 (-) Transcript_27527:36-1970(-)
MKKTKSELKWHLLEVLICVSEMSPAIACSGDAVCTTRIRAMVHSKSLRETTLENLSDSTMAHQYNGANVLQIEKSKMLDDLQKHAIAESSMGQYERRDKSNSSDQSSCEEFMKFAERDFHAFMAGEAVWETGSAITGVISTFALAASGPVVGGLSSFGFSLFTENIFPDPDEERIQNVQKGMKCLVDEVKNLAADIEAVSEHVQENSQSIENLKIAVQALSQQSFVDFLDKMESRKEKNLECTSLMRCVADFKFLKKKIDFDKDTTNCENVYPFDDHGIRITSCTSDEFLARGQDDYKFLNENFDPTSVFNILKALLGLDEQGQKGARELMDLYTGVISSVIATWLSFGEWAQAICYAYGDWSVCDHTDRENIDDGFKGFKRQAEKFLNRVDDFESKLNSEDFLTTRIQLARDGKSDQVKFDFRTRSNCTLTQKTLKRTEQTGNLGGQKIQVLRADLLSPECIPPTVLNRTCSVHPCFVRDLRVFGRKNHSCEESLEGWRSGFFSAQVQMACKVYPSSLWVVMSNCTCGWLEDAWCPNQSPPTCGCTKIEARRKWLWEDSSWNVGEYQPIDEITPIPEDQKNNVTWSTYVEPLTPQIEPFEKSRVVLKQLLTKENDPPRNSEVEPIDLSDLSLTTRAAMALIYG